ncbi:MAG TPA: SDR family NAD(P)-dependent oxidoreductase [Thermoanaerobaculia bacterium]
MSRESEAPREWNGSEVAVIGMAGRFPGAPTIERFWENLKNGVESIRFFTDEELLAAGVSPAQVNSPNYVKASPVLDNIDGFDASLFGIPPHEARLLDPQQRLFLECVWEALERAGYNDELYPGLIGVYSGLEMSSYLFYLLSDPHVFEASSLLQVELGNDKDYMATRVSYKLNLRGPSITVQTACSTSLVALHLGCQGLLSGECDLALAGGVSLKIPHTAGYSARPGSMHSPDGHCRAFDAGARGTVFGSGLGVVVLKRLADAMEDGDTIHAIVKGTAINNDGSVKIGYSAPAAEGQYQVVRAAQLIAEVEPETITYVEAHGTGTPLGDPIEVAALTRAFRAGTERKGFCALGSVKTNVGHLRSAAGVTGLIKVALSMRHRQLPPSLHFERPNPQIDFENSPFRVNSKLSDWQPNGSPLRAGLSSFGVGGTNAHVILEEAPPAQSSGPSRPWQLLALSANTAKALDTLRSDLAAHLRRNPELPLADAAFTLQVGRRPGKHRGFLACRDLAGAVEGLEGGRLQAGLQELRGRAVVFLFPGQGAQYPGMGRELYETEPAFRENVDRCCEVLKPLLGLDLREVLFPSPEEMEEAGRRLEQTALSQPALFVIEHSLALLWMDRGVRPRAMLGHSLGEYVAACLAGVFSLEDALALVAERGRLMQSLPAGAMLAVPLPEPEVAPLLGPELSLAAVNGPARTVVSGPEAAIAALEAELERRGTPGRRLHTSHAFHSGMMDPILAPFAERVRNTARNAPEVPFISNLTGAWITREEAVDPDYWARHLRSAVRFADGLQTLTADSDAVLLEVGPGQTLATFARQVLDRSAGRSVVRSLPHPKETQSAGEFFLAATGQLWLAGVDIGWRALYAGERRHRVELPTYPFEHQRFWVDYQPKSAGEAARPNVRKEIPDWFYVSSWSPSAAPEEPEADGTPHRWLLLPDRAGVAEAMARRIEARGEAVTLGEDWSEPADRVVDLRGLDSDPGGDGGFLPLLRLAQEIARRLPADGVQLRVVTAGLQAVGRGEIVTAPERATLLGVVRTLPLEHPEIACAAIDVEAPAGPEEADRLAELLIAETLVPAEEAVVAWRGEERWVERFEPVRLGRADGRRLPFRDQGVYLITGGLGGIGLVLAEELARSVRARLVLTGRSGLPDDPADRRVRAVRRLEELGAEVLVVAADVTDEAAMREAVRLARERFGAVHGAIHAAGVPGGGLIALKTAEAAEKVLAPKIQGSLNLAAALAGEPLDFVALCSSTFAATGGVGQVDYCAANNFLDAFARRWSARGVRAVAIGWGAWQEVGMAVAAASRSDLSSVRAAAKPPVPVSGPTPARAATVAPPAAGFGLHPLLERRDETPEGALAVYSGALSVDRHWILAEHLVAGTPTAPGTSYLEMARAAYALECGAREVEVRDVTFVSPMLVPGGVRHVRVVLQETADGTVFRVESRAGDGGEWQEHAHGGLRPLDGRPGHRDVEAIAARCLMADQIEGWETVNSGSSLVTWGARWRCLRRAQVGQDEALLTMELPAGFAADVEAFGLHPAILDVATAFGGGMVGGGLMLPASYGRVLYAAPLPAALYAHLHKPRQGDETLTVNVTLMTLEGEVCAEVEDFTMRRVAEGGRRPAAQTPAAAVQAVAGGSSEWILPAEGVETFRRILSRGRFPQVTVSPMDLHRTIEAMRKKAEQRSAPEPVAGQAKFQRPELGTAYAAPSTPTETMLAQVWQNVLGLEQVGVDDNFFDLGGDSVMGIQLVARASARGLQFSPEQLFEHQTIGNLARWLDARSAEEQVAPAEAVEDFGADDFADISSDDLDKILSKVKTVV